MQKNKECTLHGSLPAEADDAGWIISMDKRKEEPHNQ